MEEVHSTELIAAVVEHYRDELGDVMHYRNLAMKARRDGCTYLALIFSRIGNDEFTHAEYLRDYLIHKGVYDPDGKHKDLEEKWLDIIDD